MESDGIPEAPRDDLVEVGEARLVNIDRGDVPALVGAPVLLPPFAPPRAHPFGCEPRRDALGLLVGVLLNVPPMGCDGDEPSVRAIVRESFDELAVGLGL